MRARDACCLAARSHFFFAITVIEPYFHYFSLLFLRFHCSITFCALSMFRRAAQHCRLIPLFSRCALLPARSHGADLLMLFLSHVDFHADTPFLSPVCCFHCLLFLSARRRHEPTFFSFSIFSRHYADFAAISLFADASSSPDFRFQLPLFAFTPTSRAIIC